MDFCLPTEKAPEFSELPVIPWRGLFWGVWQGGDEVGDSDMDFEEEALRTASGATSFGNA
jgi:hypothetical protein